MGGYFDKEQSVNDQSMQGTRTFACDVCHFENNNKKIIFSLNKLYF